MVRRGVFPSLEIALWWCISGGAAGRATARRCVLGHRSAIFLGLCPSPGVGMGVNDKQLLHAGAWNSGQRSAFPLPCSKFPVEV